MINKHSGNTNNRNLIIRTLQVTDIFDCNLDNYQTTDTPYYIQKIIIKFPCMEPNNNK